MSCRWIAAAGLACVVTVAACSSEEPLPDPILVQPAAVQGPTSTTVADSLSLTPSGAVATTTTSVPASDGRTGLPATAVFGPVAEHDSELQLVRLAPVDVQNLNRRFRDDDRIEPFLSSVDARGVQRSGELIAVALAVAVTPSAAESPGFTDSLIDGATDGAATTPLSIEFEGQELVPWLTGETSSILWAHQNVYLIISGRDADDVRTLAEVMVRAALGIDPVVPDDVAGDGEAPDPADGEAPAADEPAADQTGDNSDSGA